MEGLGGALHTCVAGIDRGPSVLKCSYHRHLNHKGPEGGFGGSHQLSPFWGGSSQGALSTPPPFQLQAQLPHIDVLKFETEHKCPLWRSFLSTAFPTLGSIGGSDRMRSCGCSVLNPPFRSLGCGRRVKPSMRLVYILTQGKLCTSTKAKKEACVSSVPKGDAQHATSDSLCLMWHCALKTRASLSHTGGIGTK